MISGVIALGIVPMERVLEHLFSQSHWSLLVITIAASLVLLAWAAGRLVDEAVALSHRSGIPKTVIGATIVSLGTTTPEAAVSVLAAMKGSPGLALGNAVGSIICDTGLILGVSALIAPLRLDRRIVNHQGWIQLGAALALIAASFPWLSPGAVFSRGGTLPQIAGFVFLLALVAYLWQSIRWTREQTGDLGVSEHERDIGASTVAVIAKLIGSVALVVISAQVLIPAVAEVAARLHVPDSVIAATLVAFGTSLPELVTAVTAARRGHGEIAVGNIVGADILNVLFVAGAAAAVTPSGLQAGEHFFVVLYPTMLAILIIFRVGIFFSGASMKRGFGLVLLGVYAVSTLTTYLWPGN